MKVAVVGHVEWVQFALVERVPQTGDFAHASDGWCGAGGGAGVAAIVLAQLAGNCALFTAFGDDEIGRKSQHQLEEFGVQVYASLDLRRRSNYTFCHISGDGERTGTVINNLEPSGDDTNLPWHELEEMDAVYFVSGDKAALVQAKTARVLVSTARILPLLKTTEVPLDALVLSDKDLTEAYKKGDLHPEPSLVVRTNGHTGETANGKLYPAETVNKDEFRDSYGCGDSFAAGLTFGLGQGLDVEGAVALAAHMGAEAAKRHGAFGPIS